MGLDMYLKASVSIYNSGSERRSSILKAAGIPLDLCSEDLPHVSVDVTAAYWRKSNQIHSWFVKNVQDGVDDCREHEVTREKIVELRDLCKKVMETRDHTLLEPMGGFFFGSTDIDEWYWKDIESTVTMLDKVLKMPENVWFKYRSSW